VSARSVGVEDKILAVVAAAVVGVDGSALVAVGMASSFDDDSIVFLSVSQKKFRNNCQSFGVVFSQREG